MLWKLINAQWLSDCLSAVARMQLFDSQNGSCIYICTVNICVSIYGIIYDYHARMSWNIGKPVMTSDVNSHWESLAPSWASHVSAACCHQQASGDAKYCQSGAWKGIAGRVQRIKHSSRWPITSGLWLILTFTPESASYRCQPEMNCNN